MKVLSHQQVGEGVGGRTSLVDRKLVAGRASWVRWYMFLSGF